MTLATDAVTEALNNAVAEKGGDYTYEIGPHGSCFYSRGGAPSCIVGFVINALDPELFAKIERLEEETGSSLGIQSIAGAEPITPFDAHRTKWDTIPKFDVDHRTARALQAAQAVQDDGGTWAQAQEAYQLVLSGQGAEIADGDVAQWAQAVVNGDWEDDENE